MTLKTSAESPKHMGQLGLGVQKLLTQKTTPGYFLPGATKMLKAKCTRLAGQSTVIGNTAFAFDQKGITRVTDQGNTRLDFDVLCVQNGVVRLADDETPAQSDHVSAMKQSAVPAAAPVEPMTSAELPKGELLVVDEAPMEEATDSLETAPPDLVVPAPVEEDKPAEHKPEKFESRRKPPKKG